MPMSQTRPPVHLNSPLPHFGMQAPRVQTVPSGHGPSSILPSQSLSRPLHFLLPGATASLHTTAPSTQLFAPSLQLPSLPVSQLSPAAAHTMLSTRATRSVNSLSPP